MNQLRLRMAIDYADEVESRSTATIEIPWSGIEEDLDNCPDCVKAKILAALGASGLSCRVEENSNPYHLHDDAGDDQA